MNRIRPKTVTCALTLLASSVLVTPLAAQDPLRVPQTLRPGILNRTASVSRPIVATAPNGAWVVARGRKFRSSGIPTEMYRKLHEFTEKGSTIDEISFTPEGGWTILAGDTDWTRNVGGGYFDALQRLRRAGRTIHAVAFNPDGWAERRGFVIAHEEGIASARIPGELRDRLRRFIRDGHTIRDVAFTPDGGWTIVTDRTSWTRNVGGPSPAYFETVNEFFDRNDEVWDVDFLDPDYGDLHGWLIVTSRKFEGAAVDGNLAKALRDLLGLDGRVHARSAPARDVAQTTPQPEEEEDELEVVGWYLDQGEPFYSEISGRRDDRTRRIDLGEPMEGMSIGENSNRPCSVAVWSLDGTTNGVKCERGREHGRQRRRVDLNGHAVRRMRTCAEFPHQVGALFTESSEVKGAEIRGNLILDDGGFDQATARDKYTLPNCHEWNEWVACPSRHVASGVVAHFKVKGRKQQLEGLQLICRQIVPRFESSD